MGKDRKEKEEKPKKNDFKAFLKKRAPIYLGIIGLFMLFVVPDLMKGDLESSFPELSSEEQQVVDILMGYNGPNESGLTVMDAISMKISEEYPDEKIYDNKKTNVELIVSSVGSEEYQVVLNFESHKGEMNYNWNVDMTSGKITSNNQESKYIINLVDFYD
ncbi:hypothetical protein HX860_02680 [Marine Group I thaumarchaeote]|jgi:hypothetical protein|uniref:Uncharacterized protein n=1 Tax=Marine Group I thaumarchaeote TaxID=2511932 RepID=A0A7K4N4L2_9ARCH|nr:MAG: hypothetical protein DSN69_01125 [Nitrosopumilus sp. YT1]NMI82314.1 hypothetical protein [Candidatus Nitrosopumilus sp. MTA1]NWJ19962.1 hypothetical protein [Marine Group I thaumarchaeote]NWJ27873.1 hypothetical protein [Marine Group I thaumarchaeote]NWJ56431.1 hypothetical protein [Marine Group I thaumarchaeote]